MTTAQSEVSSPRKPLRLWPGIIAAVLLLLLKFVVPRVFPDALLIAVFGGFACTLLVIVWWVFFSRAPWLDRLAAVVLMAGTIFGTQRIVDKSIATGAMGMLFFVLAIPGLGVAFVVWAVAARRLSDGWRRATMVATIVLACGVWALFRTGGFNGEFKNDLQWRWAKTPEERLLALPAEPPVEPTPAPAPAPAKTPEKQPSTNVAVEPAPPPSAPAAKTVAQWPGFRGPHRDDVIPGVRIDTDWAQHPPVELWRRAVGPGWSSFAVQGDLVYTQEQRGPDEVVACYKLTTGKPVWTHRDKARFWESNAGAGPRSTPTLGNGRVYTFGATGIVNALDAGNGAVVWTHNVAFDTKTKTPEWGFSSSPLLFDDEVIVAASGQLVAYDAATGAARWSGPRGKASYSSPHLFMAGGVPQILLVHGAGATSVSPTDGKMLWEHAWRGYPIVQPALTADGDVLISVTDSSGTRRLAVTHEASAWSVKERWTSLALKPYFNDFVVHNGHAFGFDGGILACIDLADGKRTWKGGRYGHGQLILLSDQDLLLVLSEEGELALVSAKPDQFTEVARFPAIEGKTWNHPVLVGDVLLARNSEEMAAFRLSLAAR